ncbi:MAG: DUF421 domain-containing protein [Hyphomicrobiaceae bacterium]|nr:DUF421 domain-containing protein [Hyphomicrobiaceae bacterium]
MFELTMNPLELLVRVLAVYAFAFTLIRVIGKRHVGEMAPFDLVVLLMLSESLQNALIGEDTSITAGVVAAGLLFGVNQLVAYVSWRHKPAERLLEGVPKILVRNGVVYERILAQERITRSELMEAMRREGLTSLESVRYAILENDGVIAVGKRHK